MNCIDQSAVRHWQQRNRNWRNHDHRQSMIDALVAELITLRILNLTFNSVEYHHKRKIVLQQRGLHD